MAESSIDGLIREQALGASVQEFQAINGRRVSRFDQLGADSAAMWAVALTTPTQNSALALRTATESGSGRTRAETNNPSETGVGTK